MNRKICLSRLSRTAGFSLLELIVVIGITAILAAVGIPAVSAISDSYNLNTASQSIVGQLSFARQTALANNCAVQMRFYQLPDYKGTLVYRGVQAFQEKTDAAGVTTASPVTKAYVLPPRLWIVYSASLTTASTLFNTSSSGATSAAADTLNPLPPPYGARAYVYFRFRPNGQTDLTSSSVITLAWETARIVANNLPSNFISLQIDAVNGNVKTYQP